MSDRVTYEGFQAYLERHLPSYLDLLRQMVTINSYTANRKGVNALGKMTADLFVELGFTAETIPSAHPQYGEHVVLTRTGRRKDGRAAPKIGLVSHLDTVFPPDEEIANDFKWRRKGNKIYGPGTSDIKGGTVIIYMMMAALQTMMPDVFDAVTWVVLLDAAEEAEAEDFGQLCIQRLAGNALACLVFEGGKMKRDTFWAVVVRKGMVVYEVEVEGKASHAGSAHERGANAIVQMADVIRHIDEFTNYERDLTFNVGTVTGGTVSNRVPHYAAASVEMRAFLPTVYEDGIARMMALNKLSSVGTANGDYGCQVTVEIRRQTQPWPQNEATEKLFSVWQAAAKALGFKVLREERGGLSDGNYFWHQVPTIDGLGIAGGNAHCSERSPDGSKDQEYCLASAFVPKTMLNIAAVLKLVRE
jgi:glutamate carboxypeptidase